MLVRGPCRFAQPFLNCLLILAILLLNFTAVLKYLEFRNIVKPTSFIPSFVRAGADSGDFGAENRGPGSDEVLPTADYVAEREENIDRFAKKDDHAIHSDYNGEDENDGMGISFFPTVFCRFLLTELTIHVDMSPGKRRSSIPRSNNTSRNNLRLRTHLRMIHFDVFHSRFQPSNSRNQGGKG